MAKNGVQITITGMGQLKNNLKRLVTNVKNSSDTVIRSQTSATYETVKQAISGSPSEPIGVARQGSGNSALAGTGVEVTSTRLDSFHIGVDTGRMKGALKRSTSKEASSVAGSIGFDTSYKATEKALRHRIDWPQNADNIPMVQNKVLSHSDGGSKGSKTDSGVAPQTYVPQVLLGSNVIQGRNVLRVALYEVIKDNLIVETLASEIKKGMLK